MPPRDLKFRHCDAASVFAEVSRAAQSEEAQSLWDRLLQEMKRHHVDGAANYLENEFKSLAESLDRELTRLETEQ